MNTAHERKVKFPCMMSACVQKNIAFYRSDHLTQHVRSKHSRLRGRAKPSASVSENCPDNAEDQFSELRAEVNKLKGSVDELQLS